MSTFIVSPFRFWLGQRVRYEEETRLSLFFVAGIKYPGRKWRKCFL